MAVAQQPTVLDPSPGVDIASPQLDAECAGPGGFAPSAIGAWMVAGVTGDDASGGDDPPAHGGCADRTQDAGEACRDPVKPVVQAGCALAEVLEVLVVVSDHRVQGVRRAMDQHAGNSRDRSPPQGCHARVGRVLCQGLDGSAGQLLFRHGVGDASAQVGQPVPGGGQVVAFQLVGHLLALGGQRL